MIKNSVCRMIMPFSYVDEHIDLSIWERLSFPSSNARLFSYINPSFLKGTDQECRIYRYNGAKHMVTYNIKKKKDPSEKLSEDEGLGQHLQFPFQVNKNRFVIVGDYKENEVEALYNGHYFMVSQIQLYQFPTGIGFLVIDLSFYGDYPIDFFRDCVNQLTDLKRLMPLYSMMKAGKNKYEVVKIENMKFLGNYLLEAFSGVTFMEEASDQAPSTILDLPKKIHGFSGLLLNEKPSDETMNKELYYLRKLRNSAYMMTENEGSGREEEILMSYQNSCWGLSSEGVINISYLTGNEHTDDFFRTQFYGNNQNSGLIARNYFYLYLLVLHQRYAFIQYGHECIKMPRIRQIDGSYHIIDQDGPKKCNKKEIDRLASNQFRIENDISKLLLDYYFHEVSNISTYNDYYKRIFEVLNIDGLRSEIEQQLISMRSYTEFIAAQMEKKNDQRRGRVELLFAIFALFSLMSDLPGPFGSIIYELTGYDIFTYGYTNLIFFVVLLVTVAGTLVLHRSR